MGEMVELRRGEGGVEEERWRCDLIWFKMGEGGRRGKAGEVRSRTDRRGMRAVGWGGEASKQASRVSDVERSRGAKQAQMRFPHKTYTPTILYNPLAPLPQQRAHAGDERERVDRRAESLVEGEFYRGVGFVEGWWWCRRAAGRSLFATSPTAGGWRGSGIPRKRLLEVLLPEEIRRAGEQGEEDEVEEGGRVECEG